MTFGQRQGFGSGPTLALLTLAAVGLACFLSLEAHLKQPMLDLNIFRNIDFSLSLLIALLVFIVVAGAIFITPFFLELVKHYSTQQVGLLLAVSPVLGGVISPFSGSLSDRYGPRIVTLFGLILLAIGCLLISTFDTSLTMLGYLLRYAPFGLGLGMFQSPNNSAIMGGVPKERLGIASGLLSLSRTLGQIAGLPLMASLFATLTLTHDHLAPSVDVTTAPADGLVYGVQGTFRFAALVILAATGLAAERWRRELHSQ